MMTVRELAEKMEVKSPDVIKKLMSLGVFATINQRLETESASIIAQEFGFELDFQLIAVSDIIGIAHQHRQAEIDRISEKNARHGFCQDRFHPGHLDD